jgi:uncharacterized protein YbjT (DUF2867 family)
MPSILTVAVIGVGGFGQCVVRALQSKGIEVLLVHRHNSVPKLLSDGIKAIGVDYSDVEDLAMTLRSHKITVLISTIATAALEVQVHFVKAARAADVKLFIPSEFGRPSDGSTEDPFLLIKAKIAGI